MGYNPDQPREPAGSPTGGEWTSGGSLGAVAKRAFQTSVNLQKAGLEPTRIENIPSESNPGTNMQVLVNPGHNMMRGFMDRTLSAKGTPKGTDAAIRSITDGAGNQHFWAASQATHAHVADKMGVSWKYAGGDSLSFDQVRSLMRTNSVPSRKFAG